MNAPFPTPLRLDDMAWTTPSFSKEAINRAAKDYLDLWKAHPDVEDWGQDEWGRYDRDVVLVNHWRLCHAYPLNAIQTNLRRMARKFDRQAVIAQRTKRLVSIGTKLYYNPKMKLTQMQDVGGCRAVVKSIAAVRKLDEFIRNESRMNHAFATCDDYINKPKPSGYRGIHLVYRFQSPREPASAYNGLKIEIQLRSQAQHAWATAVETVGTFIGEALKSSLGPDNWLRFFALMGSAIAMMEKGPLVPKTPSDRDDLISELNKWADDLRVGQRLTGFANAIQTFETKLQDAHYFLLELDPAKKELAVTGFERDKLQDAQKAYAEAERRVKEKLATDAVLVSVDSIASLSRAYPNYYADTSMFLDLLNRALDELPAA